MLTIDAKMIIGYLMYSSLFTAVVIFPPFHKPLESFPLTAPVHSLFYCLPAVGNFTLWRRREKWRGPLRTHLYSSSSLSRHPWCWSRCASFVGFTLIQLPEKIIIIMGKKKKKSRQCLFFLGLVRLIFHFPVEQFLLTGLHTVSLSILCMYRVDQYTFRHWQNPE